MAVPKKKTAHQKQHQRRAHWKAAEQNLDSCSNCGAPTRRHTLCSNCGYYRGRPARRADAQIAS
ncbi:MAG: 50S ribosomal protein L32 [Candidatus Obscuribacter sp.]|nr:50S ribosomal protein L32 [Candidatus Obscuribacter sp.]